MNEIRLLNDISSVGFESSFKHILIDANMISGWKSSSTERQVKIFSQFRNDGLCIKISLSAHRYKLTELLVMVFEAVLWLKKKTISNQFYWYSGFWLASVECYLIAKKIKRENFWDFSDRIIKKDSLESEKNPTESKKKFIFKPVDVFLNQSKLDFPHRVCVLSIAFSKSELQTARSHHVCTHPPSS